MMTGIHKRRRFNAKDLVNTIPSLPLELWKLVLDAAPDFPTFRALATTCRRFRTLVYSDDALQARHYDIATGRTIDGRRHGWWFLPSPSAAMVGPFEHPAGGELTKRTEAWLLLSSEPSPLLRPLFDEYTLRFVWYQCGAVLHRDDQPAELGRYGRQGWWRHGKRHRDNNDHPAVVYPNGKQEWWHDGNRHRDNNDQPAVIWPHGAQEWWRNGNRHRDNNQPAVIWTDGTQEWWRDGERHRDNDEPALIWADGMREWWCDGNRHRDNNDQPAVIRSDGMQEWWRDGNRHRDNDQPALIWSDGTREWWRDGTQVWWYNDMYYTHTSGP